MSVLDETRLTFAEAAALMGVHINSIVRWRMKGVRGVKLSTFMVGGVRVTSRERLEEFIRATTEADDGAAPPSESRTTKQRERAVAAAEKRLDALGV